MANTKNIVDYTEKGTPIYRLENGSEQALLDNDYYEEKDFGKFVIQIKTEEGWELIENGIVENEDLAQELVDGMINLNLYPRDEIRYEQI